MFLTVALLASAHADPIVDLTTEITDIGVCTVTLDVTNQQSVFVHETDGDTSIDNLILFLQNWVSDDECTTVDFLGNPVDFCTADAGYTFTELEWSVSFDVNNGDAASLAFNDALAFDVNADDVQTWADYDCCALAADYNLDGTVGGADLLILLAAWGPVVPETEYLDENADGQIGAAEYLTLLGQYGESCD